MQQLIFQVREALCQGRRAIVSAPPGTGKSTLLPPALLDEVWLQGRKILVLEPRRLAAKALAGYVARQRGEAVGNTVGLRVRLESRVSPSTRLEYITEGVLNRMIQEDPELQDVACIFFDEFHERSLQGDLALALCLEIQQSLRPDLRMVVLSATLNHLMGKSFADPFYVSLDTYLHPCSVLEAQAQTFPVDISYAAFPKGLEPWQQAWIQHIKHQCLLALKKGSVLVFLPGSGEIYRCAEALNENLASKGLLGEVSVHPLFGDLSLDAQSQAISPALAGKKKIVLATNLAQTSLTIEGIACVVDSGLERVQSFDPSLGMGRLVTQRISQASAVQRAGRAGRTQAGFCLRLWEAGESLRPQDRPEILDADATALVLELLAWGSPNLDFLSPLPQASREHALETLQLLGAISQNSSGSYSITTHGKALLALPLHPRLGHMLCVGKAQGIVSLAALLAVILSERDPLRSVAHAGVDLRMRLNLFTGQKNFGKAQPAIQRLLQLAHKCQDLFAPGPFILKDQDLELAGELVAQSWPERVAQNRGDGSFRLACGRGAKLPELDPLTSSPWLAIAHMDAAAGREKIHLAAPICQQTLEKLFPQHIKKEIRITWDKRSEAVEAKQQTRLQALVLESTALSLDTREKHAEAIQSAVLTGIRQLGLDCLPWTAELVQWLARVELLRSLVSACPNPWPAMDVQSLLDTLEHWLLPFLSGISRRSHFTRIPLQAALHSCLSYAQAKELEKEAPTHITVPSGSSIAVDYSPTSAPVLAVKLQEMFGLCQGPTIAGGRIPLTLHLLSPAGRPLQVTSNLASFWANVYPQVRAEARGRYPKHPWPENPLEATATRLTKRASLEKG